MTNYAPHLTVAAVGPFGIHEIDSLLAPYVQALWAQGVTTWSSCQGSEFHPGYIGGPRTDHLLLAREILVRLGLELVDEPSDDPGWTLWFVPLTEVTA